MRSHPEKSPASRVQAWARRAPLLLIVFTIACALPFVSKPTPTRWSPSPTPSLPPTATPTPQPQPPALVEIDPPVNAELPLNGPITLYFNQDMDRASVEAALNSQMGPGLAFTWVDNSTVIVYLSAPLQPDTQLSLMVSDNIRSAQGKPLLQPISLNYRTAGFLGLSLALPENGAMDVDPTAAVVAAFNRPIVALGADPASLPQAFSLEPAAEGRGEWLNTSTYAFYPMPALEGGRQYTVHINPDLKSADGGPLKGETSWSFTTSRPQLLSMEPTSEIPWRIDAKVVLHFNQPMDTASVENNFSLLASNGEAIPGKASWSEEDTVFTFTPDALLARGATYIVSLNGQALGRGGAPLGESFNASIVTVAPLQVVNTEPGAGALLDPTNNLGLYFSAPIQDREVLQHVSLEPAAPNLDYYWDESVYALRLRAAFAPNTTYTLRVSGLVDVWGGAMSQDFVHTFTTSSFQPNLNLISATSTIFLTGQDRSLQVQAVNLPSVPLSLGALPLKDFLALNSPGGYEMQESLQRRERQTWVQSLDSPSEQMQVTELYLSPERALLSPGLYFLNFNFAQESDPSLRNIYSGPFLLVVSNLQLTFKASATDALIWAVDLRDNSPVADAPVVLYNEKGDVLARGQTDSQGVYQALYEPLESVYQTVTAVIGQPGDDLFGLALSSWTAGIEPWDFGLHSGGNPPGLRAYFYTDRPIYRPGQTVYFRAILRNANNGRYTPPEITRLSVTITGEEGRVLAEFELPVSGMGTAHGEFTLPDDATPGYYSINTSLDQNSYLGFQVANYRKPEINLQVGFTEEQIQAGDKLHATVQARYFYDAPANNLEAHWALYRSRTFFDLPGYRVGKEDTSWLEAFRYPEWFGNFGELVDEGQAETDAEGSFALELPTQPADERYQYSLEVTLTDESGLPVSARSSALVNPDDFYIGIRPDAWVIRAGEQAGFDVLVVDWRQNPMGADNLRAEFQKVVWRRIDPPANQPYESPKFEPQYTPVGITDFAADAQGRARLAFTPTEPGTYLLDVYNLQAAPGKGARSQFLLWVSGAGQAVWPNLPNSRLRLVADRADYQPGDTAQIFIPNPFGKPVQALLTVERSVVIKHEILSVPAEGYNLSLPLPADYAPNVYLSVTLLGSDERGLPDFRQGYLNVPVAPLEQTLQVRLVSEPQRAAPGDAVTFDLQVTDSAGNPVQGEFSLAVVDLAVLALAEPNSPDIVSAFYAEQPIGVRTSLALAAYNRRQMNLIAGLGGGGGAEAPQVAREDFPDTAYWNAEIVTDANGRAQVHLNLPDTLTTWQVETRGVTQDTRVGQAQTQVIATKELLIRPVTPRFFVVNDHAQVSAVVQNNTDAEMQVEASLQASGLLLDEASRQTQQVNVPAHGRARVEWWGVVQDVTSVDLIFSAQSGSYQDATRPTRGALPVLRYFAPQTFRTSGVIDAAGELTELVSLPRSFEAQSGELNVELSPSLAAAISKALNALENQPFESAEQTLSSFLPNLETYRTLQTFGVEDPGLKSRLDRTLNQGLLRLLARQNYDGGWGWWKGEESDAYVTSYVLFGLLRARQAGITVSQDTIQRAIDYLKQALPQNPEGRQPLQPWQWDRLAFQEYVLSEADAGSAQAIAQLIQERDQLSPWAQALLALALQRQQPGASEAQTILSDLQSNAVRSATGAYWEMRQDESGLLAAGMNMQTNLSNSAIVLFALAQRDPGSPLVADAVRYLMTNRSADGGWASTYSAAWTLLALNEVIQGTGELAGNFTFEAALNGNVIAQGKAAEAQQITPVIAQTPLSRLYPDYPNPLTIRRDGGAGRLYYAVGLQVSRPVEDVTPLSQGITIERAVYPFGDACTPQPCQPFQFAKAGQKVTVRLTLTAPHDLYYLAVSDYIPAGAEILDTRLQTSQLGVDAEPEMQTIYNPRRPYSQGWGWWLFSTPQIYDDHISWTIRHLPAGTYELTYTLVLLQPGEYRVLPARAWQLYFPEVQANSAGSVFEIRP